MFYAEQLGSYWIVPLLELLKFVSRNKTGKNVRKYHILFSGIREGKATTNPRFDEFKD